MTVALLAKVRVEKLEVKDELLKVGEQGVMISGFFLTFGHLGHLSLPGLPSNG